MNQSSTEASIGLQRRRLGSRRTVISYSLLAGTLLASSVLGSTLSLGPIYAATQVVNDPPPAGHQIISFPSRDFVTAGGYSAADGPFTVQVLRNGSVIGQSDPAQPDSGGLIQINHPGVAPDPTYCWGTTPSGQFVTPDILPGDVVRVINAAGTIADQTPTANVTSQFPTSSAAYTDAAGVTRYDITVKGTAQDALGAPLPTSQVEARLVANKNSFDINGRRTLRAGGAGKDGTLAYDAAGSINWTAVFKGLDQRDHDLAMSTSADQSRALWLGRDPLAGTELTIFEANLVTPGPQAPCTAPLAAAPPAPGADTAAPSVPTNVSATVSGSNNVTVSWTASTDNIGVKGYDVFRNGLLVTQVGAPNTSLADNGVPDGTYTYTVDAFDAAGNKSAPSTASPSVTTVAPPPPPVGVNDPPPAGRQIISFPSREFVTASGYSAASGPYQVQVFRAGKLIGTSDQAMPDSTGLIQINHPGTAPDPTYCWQTVTPNILPGDVIRVINTAGTIADQTTTANVTSQFPTSSAAYRDAAGVTRYDITVKGTAQDALGAPLPTSQVEARLVANKNSFDINGRRTLRAGGAGKDGTLAYDAAGSINWTAVFKGLDQRDHDLAMSTSADQSRALWLGRDPLAGTELTIFEANLVTPGPQAPCAQ